MYEPSVGRIVHYTLDAQDAEQINRRRADARGHHHQRLNTGGVVHVGNQVYAEDVYPLIIVRVWLGPVPSVNGQVLLDGNDTLWVVSRQAGDGPGTWAWPERV